MASIFLGVTTSPAREFVAKCFLDRNPGRLLMPCAGRFAAVEALIGSGIPREKIWASDIGLFSSIIGYLADPRHSLDELGIELTGELPPMPASGLGCEYDFGAQVMASIALGQMSAKHQKGIDERRELLRCWGAYHHGLAVKLKTLVDALRGIHYDIADLWNVVRSATPDDGMYINVPTYKGGYDRMFKGAQARWSAEPEIEQFDYKQYPELLRTIHGTGSAAMVYAQKQVIELPEGWHVVFGQTINRSRADYIVASWDTAERLAVTNIREQSIKRFPVYCEEEITPASKLTMIRVDEPTCLYYRDLFVHKLGTTKAEVYFLMLIDGRVITAFGIHWDFIRRFQSDYVYEDFGISKSSVRYSRLGKLFMLALTSGSTKRFLESELAFGVHDPRGIQTTSITTHREGKTDRNVMKRVHCEELEDGRFRLIYRGDFRTDTWDEVLQAWLKRWGELRR